MITRAATMEQPETQADDGFRQPDSIQEWKSWVSKRPKLMIRNHKNKSGTQWIPGYQLNDAYGKDQITVIAPGGRQVITVPMEDVKLWKKDIWKQEQLRASGREEKKIDTRVELAPTDMRDPSRWVLYVPKTGLFVGGGGSGKKSGRNITAHLDEADSYASKQCAYATRSLVASAFHGIDVKYLTRRDAEILVKERAEDAAATQEAIDNLLIDHEKERADAAKAAAEEAAKPKLVDVPDEVATWAKINPTPLPKTVIEAPKLAGPVPTKPAPTYNEIEQAIMDEAEAEAMMWEAKGRRIRAEAKQKIEALRKAAT